MRHRIGFGAAALATWMLLATSYGAIAADKADESLLIEMETAAWEAWKTGNDAFFESHVADQGVLIMGDGRRIGKAAAVEQIAEGVCEVSSFELSDFHVHSVGSGTKILSYEARQDAVCDGTRVPEHLLVSSIYDRRDGEWVNVHYQETVRTDDEAQE